MLALLFCTEFCNSFLFGATLSCALFILSLFLLLFRDILEEFLVEILTSGFELADCLFDELGTVNSVEVAILPLIGN